MTADERLALIRLKIKRADKHIEDLKAEIGAFRASNPYEVATKRNPQTGQLIYYLASMKPIPGCIAAITGDILNALRSSLDHLAQQLYLVASGAPDFRDETAFLISPSAEKFKKRLPRKVQGMRQDAIDAICALEPYDGGKGADLWTFNRLTNIDKHRLIVTVWAKYDSVNIGPIVGAEHRAAFGLPEAVTFPDLFLRSAPPSSPLKVGDELLILNADANPQKTTFVFEIVIHESKVLEFKPIFEALVQFRERISGVVEGFKPFLARRARQPRTREALIRL